MESTGGQREGAAAAVGTARLPRGSLDAQVILRTAKQLTGRSGLAEVTIKKVAAELGVQHTAVHHHFPRRSDLVEALMIDAVEQFNGAFPDVPMDDWESHLRGYWTAFRAVLRADRTLFELVVGQWVAMGRSRRAVDLSFRRIDAQLEVLLRAGFSPDQAGYAYHLLSTYTRGCLISEYQFAQDGAGLRTDEQVSPLQLSGAGDQFPNLRRVVARHWSYTFATDADFDHGLDVILSGLRAWLAGQGKEY